MPLPTRPALTVRVLQLSHGGHEGLLGQVAARALLQEWLLVRAVQLLGELRRLQGRQAARHTVDDRDALRLRGVEACGSKRERSGTLQRGGEVNGRQRLQPWAELVTQESAREAIL